MSVIVARDEVTARHIIFPWPDPVPWGAELICSDGEVVVICPNWQVGEQLGPGRHTVSPPNPQAHILAYFIRTTAEQVSFERTISVIDRHNNQTVLASYQGTAKIKVGDPTLMCHQLVGLPYHDLATGVLYSAMNSLGKVFQHVITKVCMASPSVSTITNPEAVAQLVQMAANANPMAIAVTGLELVEFGAFRLSIDGSDPIEWATDSDTAKTTPLKLADRPIASGPTTARLPSVDGGKTKQKKAGPVPAKPAAKSPKDDEKSLPAGSRVLVYGHDGLWHAGKIQQYDKGRYLVAIEGSDSPVWVMADQVRPH